MIITPARFCQIGEALFGRSWKAELADALEICERLVYRIANGQRNVSPEIRAGLAKLCRTRGVELMKIADGIDPHKMQLSPHSQENLTAKSFS